MKYQVIWSNFAEIQLDRIFDYYIKNASVKVAKKIIRNLILAPNKLIKNPFLGPVEELLLGRKEN